MLKYGYQTKAWIYFTCGSRIVNTMKWQDYSIKCTAYSYIINFLHRDVFMGVSDRINDHLTDKMENLKQITHQDFMTINALSDIRDKLELYKEVITVSLTIVPATQAH
jgi:hypothetical protein